MPFDEELVVWLSATDTLESLFQWFSIEDIIRLQKKGWSVHEYQTESYKFYDKFQHYVINQQESILVGRIDFNDNSMKVQTTQDIPKEWVSHRVKKNTLVNIRKSNGVERFKVSWSDSELISDPDLDIIVISDEGREYPCKLDIFKQTYEFVQIDKNGNPAFGKTATYTIVEIPEGFVLEVVTLEGPVQDVSYPDYLAIGPKGEVYVNTKEFVEKNLSFVD